MLLLRDRLLVPLALRVRVRLEVRVRVRVRVPLALLLATGAGALYAHCSPTITSRPLAPPTWMKYERWLATIVSADARPLEPHAGAAASSLPARQPNGSAQFGQPVPTYSTVLSVVKPHVDSRSMPPSGVLSLSVSAYTSREPG